MHGFGFCFHLICQFAFLSQAGKENRKARWLIYSIGWCVWTLKREWGDQSAPFRRKLSSSITMEDHALAGKRRRGLATHSCHIWLVVGGRVTTPSRLITAPSPHAPNFRIYNYTFRFSFLYLFIFLYPKKCKEKEKAVTYETRWQVKGM